MNKIARILITTQCNLKCSYCCNSLPEIQKSINFTTFDQFIDKSNYYDTINITGGEPTLSINKLFDILIILKNNKYKGKIYLYTNGYDHGEHKKLCKYFNGINIGCHGNFKETLIEYRWYKAYIKNVIIHIQKGILTNDDRKIIKKENIKIKEWTLNECNNTKEDRFIL